MEQTNMAAAANLYPAARAARPGDEHEEHKEFYLLSLTREAFELYSRCAAGLETA